MKIYEFISEQMVNLPDETLPMWELQDVKRNTYFVKAEDVSLYNPKPSEIEMFIIQKGE